MRIEFTRMLLFLNLNCRFKRLRVFIIKIAWFSKREKFFLTDTCVGLFFFLHTSSSLIYFLKSLIVFRDVYVLVT